MPKIKVYTQKGRSFLMGNKKSSDSVPPVFKDGKLLDDAQKIIVRLENTFPQILMPLKQKVAECQSQVGFFEYLADNTQMRGLANQGFEPYAELTGQVDYLRRRINAFEKRLVEAIEVHVQLMKTMKKYKKWFEGEEILSLKDSDISELRLLLGTDKRVAIIRNFNADRFEMEWNDWHFREQLDQCITDLSKLFLESGYPPR